MRYALRNQQKIEAAYPGMLKRILDSLKSHFENHESIEIYDSRDQYPIIIIISDVGHTVNMISFYVLEIKFDVYRLAFKEFIG